tara:strand:+ start:3331 stop:4059 length:729 start_codon:yes stop_codon:yes gene_type:complete
LQYLLVDVARSSLKIFQKIFSKGAEALFPKFKNKLAVIFAMLALLMAPANGSDEITLWDSDDLEALSPAAIDAVVFKMRPIIGSFWAEPPDIRICAETGISKSRARAAIESWRRLGYSIGYIFYDSNSHVCRSNGLYGEIIVKLVTSDTPIQDQMAVTSVTYQKNNRNIRKAVIYVLGGYASYPRLLEHELGHAFGWRHFNRRLHIMNPIYKNGGIDSFGLNYKNYEQEIATLEKRFKEKNH